MQPMPLRDLAAFYDDHLFGVLLPFWMPEGTDREHGAFSTCFTNAGDRLVSKNKYIRSQDRFLGMLGRFARGFAERMGSKLTVEADGGGPGRGAVPDGARPASQRQLRHGTFLCAGTRR